ncbi:WHG domain-containing protein [Streptomyces sp. NBC_00322]|uniref:TetR/AcrR family transcriptional regulator n=1 Tax=Streptomyces sp. NBC_00322 TaxID=2975712 RepID=UPI002E2D741A|nr:TetR-like C-terminal domain-containing protein [Streptomyces sp. NBC_00322]
MTTDVESAHQSGRAALLAAARAELAQVGVGELSLRAVARRAGVSHAAPKHHFAHRAGLLSALAADGFTALAARLDTVVTGGGSPLHRLVAAGHAYLRFAQDEPALFDLMYRPELLSSADPALLAGKRAAFGMLVQVVDEARTDLRPDIGTDDIALLAWATVHGMAVLIRDRALEAVEIAEDAGQSAALAGPLVEALGRILSVESR